MAETIQGKNGVIRSVDPQLVRSLQEIEEWFLAQDEIEYELATQWLIQNFLTEDGTAQTRHLHELYVYCKEKLEAVYGSQYSFVDDMGMKHTDSTPHTVAPHVCNRYPMHPKNIVKWIDTTASVKGEHFIIPEPYQTVNKELLNGFGRLITSHKGLQSIKQHPNFWPCSQKRECLGPIEAGNTSGIEVLTSNGAAGIKQSRFLANEISKWYPDCQTVLSRLVPYTTSAVRTQQIWPGNKSYYVNDFDPECSKAFKWYVSSCMKEYTRCVLQQLDNFQNMQELCPDLKEFKGIGADVVFDNRVYKKRANFVVPNESLQSPYPNYNAWAKISNKNAIIALLNNSIHVQCVQLNQLCEGNWFNASKIVERINAGAVRSVKDGARLNQLETFGYVRDKHTLSDVGQLIEMDPLTIDQVRAIIADASEAWHIATKTREDDVCKYEDGQFVVDELMLHGSILSWMIQNCKKNELLLAELPPNWRENPYEILIYRYRRVMGQGKATSYIDRSLLVPLLRAFESGPLGHPNLLYVEFEPTKARMQQMTKDCSSKAVGDFRHWETMATNLMELFLSFFPDNWKELMRDLFTAFTGFGDNIVYLTALFSGMAGTSFNPLILASFLRMTAVAMSIKSSVLRKKYIWDQVEAWYGSFCIGLQKHVVDKCEPLSPITVDSTFIVKANSPMAVQFDDIYVNDFLMPNLSDDYYFGARTDQSSKAKATQVILRIKESMKQLCGNEMEATDSLDGFGTFWDEDGNVSKFGVLRVFLKDDLNENEKNFENKTFSQILLCIAKKQMRIARRESVKSLGINYPHLGYKLVVAVHFLETMLHSDPDYVNAFVDSEWDEWSPSRAPARQEFFIAAERYRTVHGMSISVTKSKKVPAELVKIWLKNFLTYLEGRVPIEISYDITKDFPNWNYKAFLENECVNDDTFLSKSGDPGHQSSKDTGKTKELHREISLH